MNLLTLHGRVKKKKLNDIYDKNNEKFKKVKISLQFR